MSDQSIRNEVVTLDALIAEPWDLDVLEQSVRKKLVQPNLEKLHDTECIRQSRLLDLRGANFHYVEGVIHNTMARLEKLLPAAQTFAPNRSRAYLEDDSVALLMWLAAWARSGHPSQAAKDIREHRATWNAAAGPVAEILAEIGFDRFKRLVGSRLLAAALSAIFGERAREPGTVAFYRRIRPDEGPGANAAEWIDSWLRRSFEGDSALLPIGLIDSVGDLLFHTKLSSRVASGKSRLYALIPPQGPPKYLLLLIGLDARADASVSASDDTPAPRDREEQPKTTVPVTAGADTAALVEHLLDGLTVGMEHLERDVHALAAPLQGQDPRRLWSVNVLLWMLARFARLLSLPDGPGAAREGPESTRCFILEPRDRGRGSRKLVERAASDGGPWMPAGAREFTIKNNELLSGYAASTSLTLVIERSDPPMDRLVSRHTEELQSVNADHLACIAVPAPREGPEIPTVLYVCMTAATNGGVEFSVRARAVQILGPVLAEILHRGRFAQTAISSCAQVLGNTCLSENELRQKFNTAIEQLMWPRADAKPSEVDLDERLALIVVKALPGRTGLRDVDPEPDPRFASIAASWLGKLLPQYLQPFQLLADFRARIRSNEPLAEALERLVWGQFGHGIAILIPHFLLKHERDLLRHCVSIPLNALGDGLTDEGQAAVRASAWLVVEKCPPGTKHAVFADKLWTAAQRAEHVLAEVVAANQEAYEAGDWAAARLYLSRARASLEELELSEGRRIDHQAVLADELNDGVPALSEDPYLHRRDAEFCLRLGQFAAAERIARRAVAADSRSVTARCLLADALLACGRPWDAIDELKNGLSATGEVATYDEQALFAYHKSFALLVPALLLRQHMQDLLLKYEPPPAANHAAVHARKQGSHGLADSGRGEESAAKMVVQLKQAQQTVRRLARAAAKSFESSGSYSLSTRKTTLPFELADAALLLTNFSQTPAFGAVQGKVLAGNAPAALVQLDVAAQAYPRDSLVFFEQLWVRMWESGGGGHMLEELTDDRVERMVQG